MKRLRIMLVEDDALICSLIVELLDGMGHDVCATAGTESEAILAAAQHHPDLMLVDVDLGAGSGVAAVAEIIRHAPIPHIFMTGGSRRKIPPCSDVLAKPFKIATLTTAVDRATCSIAANSQ